MAAHPVCEQRPAVLGPKALVRPDLAQHGVALLKGAAACGSARLGRWRSPRPLAALQVHPAESSSHVLISTVLLIAIMDSRYRLDRLARIRPESPLCRDCFWRKKGCLPLNSRIFTLLS